MPHEMLVGLQVTDDELYAEYRRLITPLLEQRGGGFRYDFTVSDVLSPAEAQNINRVFVIFFGSREQKDELFSDATYLAIKEQYFAPSVKEAVIISEYDV